MAAYLQVDDLLSPAGWLPVHRDQLQAQRSTTSMGSLYLFSGITRPVIGSQGLRLSPGASAYQRIIFNNYYAHNEQRVNPGQIRGFDGVLYKLWPVADVLISSVNVSAALTWELKQIDAAKCTG